MRWTEDFTSIILKAYRMLTWRPTTGFESMQWIALCGHNRWPPPTPVPHWLKGSWRGATMVWKVKTFKVFCLYLQWKTTCPNATQVPNLTCAWRPRPRHQHTHPQDSTEPEFAVFASSPSSQPHLGKSTPRKERLKEQEEWQYQGRLEQLISRGVFSDQAALLPRSPEEPFPTPISEDLAVIEEQKCKEECEKRKTS